LLPLCLFLSNTFTNGNVLRILGRNRFYLRSAQTIEDIAGVDHIVLDKTGTLTSAQELSIRYEGKPLTTGQEQRIAALAANSNHPLSKAIVSGWANREGKARRL
jgi:Cu+-exporting ATPase